jgi:pimeloyl-ACP methyl ester carboxylesterase
MSRPAIVLMHGAGSSFENSWVRRGWIDVLESLGYDDIVAAHLPGHGPEATEQGAVGGIAESVLDVIGGDEPVDAMGFSAGGYAVLSAVARSPQRFRRVVLLAVGDHMMANNIGPRLELADSLLAPDGPGRSAARPFRRIVAEAGNDLNLVVSHLRTPRPTVTDSELAAIAAPVLIVVGGADEVGPADRLQAMIPVCTVTRPEGLGHHATLSDPRSLEAVRAFLGQE